MRLPFSIIRVQKAGSSKHFRGPWHYSKNMYCVSLVTFISEPIKVHALPQLSQEQQTCLPDAHTFSLPYDMRGLGDRIVPWGDDRWGGGA